MEVTLRPAVTEDAADLAAIQAASWNAAFVEILTPEILREYTDCAGWKRCTGMSLLLRRLNDIGTCGRCAPRLGRLE